MQNEIKSTDLNPALTDYGHDLNQFNRENWNAKAPRRRGYACTQGLTEARKIGCKNLPAFTLPALSRAEAERQYLQSLTVLQKTPRFSAGSLAECRYCPRWETGAARGRLRQPPHLPCAFPRCPSPLTKSDNKLHRQPRGTSQGRTQEPHRRGTESSSTALGQDKACLLFAAAPASLCPRGLVTPPGVRCHVWIHNQCPSYMSLRGAGSSNAAYKPGRPGGCLELPPEQLGSLQERRCTWRWQSPWPHIQAPLTASSG